jgi:anti-sigma factor ChrR (cupin superfamily)
MEMLSVFSQDCETLDKMLVLVGAPESQFASAAGSAMLDKILALVGAPEASTRLSREARTDGRASFVALGHDRVNVA